MKSTVFLLIAVCVVASETDAAPRPVEHIHKDQHVVISFDFFDRCSNYPSLEECKRPVPKPDKVTVKNAPYAGLVAKDMQWFFKDEVTYFKDQHTVKVAIRLAHDPMRATRRHVVMKKLNSSEFLQYEEIEKTDVDAKCSQKKHIILRCESSAPPVDSNTEEIMKLEDPGNVLKPGVVGLSLIEQELHSHIRQHFIAGFGRILLDADSALEILGRSNGVYIDNLNIDKPVAQLFAATEKKVEGNIKSNKIFDQLQNAPGFNSKSLGKKFALNVPIKTGDSKQPKCLYGTPDVQRKNGLLRWPGFNRCEKHKIATKVIPPVVPRRLLGAAVAKSLKQGAKTAQNPAIVGTKKAAAAKKLIKLARKAAQKQTLHVSKKTAVFKAISDKAVAKNAGKKETPVAGDNTTVNKEFVKVVGQKATKIFGMNTKKVVKAAIGKKATLALKKSAKAAVKMSKKSAHIVAKSVTKLLKISQTNTHDGSDSGDDSFSETDDEELETLFSDHDTQYLLAEIDKKMAEVNFFGLGTSEKDGEPKARARGGFVQTSTGCKFADWTTRHSQNNFSEFTQTGPPYYRTPLSSSCVNMEKEVVTRTYGVMKVLINTHMKSLDDIGAIIMQGVDDCADMEKKMTTIIDVLGALNIPLTMMGFLPAPFGAAFKTFKDVLANLKSKLIPVRDKVKSVNAKLTEYQVRSRTCSLREKQDKLADYMINASYYESRAVAYMLHADSICPNVNTLHLLCNEVGKYHKIFNDAVALAKSKLDNVISIFKVPIDFLNLIRSFLSNPIAIAMTQFFSFIGSLLQPFTDLLKRVISVTVPIPGIAYKQVCATVHYPCGVKICGGWFKYPCGVNMCSKSGCVDVPYPTVSMKSFSFTVADIIQGILSVLGIIMDALMAAVKSIIPGLPNLSINIPGLEFPHFDLPSIALFDINFPSFPLPNIQFPFQIPTQGDVCNFIDSQITSVTQAVVGAGAVIQAQNEAVAAAERQAAADKAAAERKAAADSAAAQKVADEARAAAQKAAASAAAQVAAHMAKVHQSLQKSFRRFG